MTNGAGTVQQKGEPDQEPHLRSGSHRRFVDVDPPGDKDNSTAADTVPTSSTRQLSVVPRRVLEQLSGDDELVVVHTPRFSGASTLLRAWLAELTASDLAVAHVIDPAVDIAEEGYWSRLDAMLRSRLAQSEATAEFAQSAFASVLDSLSASTEPVGLILDDLHLIDDAVTRVKELLEHAPPRGLRIIATTRFAGEWPARIYHTPRHRFIAPAGVLFEPADIARLLKLSDIDYDVRSAEIIHRVSDGLPALVHAVCSAAPASEIARPEHLAEHALEVIDREVDATIRGDRELAAHRPSLLMSAAADPLNQISAALLFEGDEYSHAFITALGRSGMTRISGSPTDRQFHFPNPIRLSLLRLAAAEAPEELRNYRNALVRLWRDLDRPNDAVKAAADAEDWELAVEILRENVKTLYTRDYPMTMASPVLARIPPELVADDPVLSRINSVHHQFPEHRDIPGPLHGSDPVDSEDVDADKVNADCDPQELLVRAVELRLAGHFDESAKLCDILFSLQHPGSESLAKEDRDARAFTFVQIGISYLMVGRFNDAISTLRLAYRIAIDRFLLRDSAGKLSLLYALLGRDEAAKSWLDEERRHPALPPATESLVRPAGDIAAVLLALDRFDTEAAIDVLHDLGPPADREEFWGFSLFVHGQLALVNETQANSLRFIETELLRYPGKLDHGSVVAPLLDAVRADLNLACDRPKAALELVAQSSHPATTPARSRALLLAGEPATALALAQEAMSDPLTSTRDALELELVASAAALAVGNGPLARRFFVGAIATYRMTGLQQPFRSLPERIVRRLTELGPEMMGAADAVVPGFGALYITGFDACHPASGAARTGIVRPAPGEPLTVRELTVLRALATGATNRLIAERGFVSVNTVKSQLRAIYRKLGVTSREDAVAAAKRLGTV